MAKKRKKQKNSFRIKKRWTFAGISIIALIIFIIAFFSKDDISDVEVKTVGFHLKEASFSDLSGFNDDNILNAEKAMRGSCKILAKRPISYYADKQEWQSICKDMLSQEFATTAAFKRFIKNNFKPYLVTFNGDPKGLFTGYYVPLLEGSRQKTKEYNIPIYAQPRDIVHVNVSEFFPECKNCKIVGRVENKKIVPYHVRQKIDEKEIDAEVLVWLKDPVDSFILHIQGSGKVKFPDGVIKTIGFAGYNGHDFVGIGTLMIKEKLIKSGDYSMPSIRKWLQANPKKAQELMWKNPRYIFFRKLDTDPVGGQGVPLTARRSLAIDTKFIKYGVPIWLDTVDADKNPLQRLMIAQDTGGAIKGAVRGDFFWGEGDEAFNQAGRMKRNGKYFVLLPIKNHFTTKVLEQNKAKE